MKIPYLEDFEEMMDAVAQKLKSLLDKNNKDLQNKLNKTGDASDTTVTFTQASTRTNIASGEKASTIFGKIMKWFADLKTVAFTGAYSDLSGTPTSLKNPNALKFTGAITESYDGSSEKTVNIPLQALNGKWFNTDNGEYKFIVNSNGWLESNNTKQQSKTAMSEWKGIFFEDTDFNLHYKVSSEPTYDKLTVILDGTTIVNAISGVIEDDYTTTLSVGVHTLKATYSKDGSQDKNDDKAYLQFDNVIMYASDISSSGGGLTAADVGDGDVSEISDASIDAIVNGTYQ